MLANVTTVWTRFIRPCGVLALVLVAAAIQGAASAYGTSDAEDAGLLAPRAVATDAAAPGRGVLFASAPAVGVGAQATEACPPYLLEIGPLVLRMPGSAWTGISGRSDPRGLPQDLPRCGDDRVYVVRAILFTGARLPMTFQNGCAPWGQPRDVQRPECLAANDPNSGLYVGRPGDWPQWDHAWRRFFVDGLPRRIVLRTGRSSFTWQDRIRGSIAVRSRLGNTVHVLPPNSSGVSPPGGIYVFERSDGRDPLLVQCASTVELAEPSAQGSNTSCSVSYILADGVTLNCEMNREIFDEGDWASLHDRVVQWIDRLVVRRHGVP